MLTSVVFLQRGFCSPTMLQRIRFIHVMPRFFSAGSKSSLMSKIFMFVSRRYASFILMRSSRGDLVAAVFSSMTITSGLPGVLLDDEAALLLGCVDGKRGSRSLSNLHLPASESLVARTYIAALRTREFRIVDICLLCHMCCLACAAQTLISSFCRCHVLCEDHLEFRK